jgi:predicted MFS family arabinose efflux permease
MEPRHVSPTALLVLFCTTVIFTNLSVLMLGPLLIGLAHAFQTSVAVVGQFATATALTWGLVAPLAGPISDSYGRRRLLLTGLLLMVLGLLGAALAWTYGALLACRLLTGVGAAMVNNLFAVLADVFPPQGAAEPLAG